MRTADASFVRHGFVRAPHGSFTIFDGPGVGVGVVPSINPAGAITGTYFDAANAHHGFVRTAHGALTTFDPPNAGRQNAQGTYPLSMNAAAAIAGAYLDATTLYHGFLRAPDGTLATFDAPGAGTGIFRGTYAVGINHAGAIAGTYFDTNSAFPGFVRAANGTFTTFPARARGSFRAPLHCAIMPPEQPLDTTSTPQTSRMVLCAAANVRARLHCQTASGLMEPAFVRRIPGVTP